MFGKNNQVTFSKKTMICLLTKQVVYCTYLIRFFSSLELKNFTISIPKFFFPATRQTSTKCKFLVVTYLYSYRVWNITRWEVTISVIFVSRSRLLKGLTLQTLVFTVSIFIVNKYSCRLWVSLTGNFFFIVFLPLFVLKKTNVKTFFDNIWFPSEIILCRLYLLVYFNSHYRVPNSRLI